MTAHQRGQAFEVKVRIEVRVRVLEGEAPILIWGNVDHLVYEEDYG